MIYFRLMHNYSKHLIKSALSIVKNTTEITDAVWYKQSFC